MHKFYSFNKKISIITNVNLQVYFNCLTREYGNCVEDVFIHTPQDKEPEFGKIVFKFLWVKNSILKEKEPAMIHIGDKSIYLKEYKPPGSSSS